MTHGEAYWCVRRRNPVGVCDWLRTYPNAGSGFDGWVSRNRYLSLREAMLAKWDAVDEWPHHTFTVVRVTHRRKGT